MGENCNFIYDYFYGDETLKFSFIRVPKLLISKPEFKNISNDAKLLFGLLFDRSTLSQKNNWLDENNRVYIIFTIDEICEELNIGREKAVKILKELESAGLVSKKRRGLGKPSLLYVHNFDDRIPNSQKSGNQNSRSTNIELQEVGNDDLLNSANPTSRILDSDIQEVRDSDSNNNNMSYPDKSYTQSDLSEKPMDEIDRYISLIRENLDYSATAYPNRHDQEDFDSIFNLICDVVCVEAKTITVNGKEYPYSIIKSTFLKLRRDHVDYVIECLRKNTKEIRNMRGYLISCLYNASITIDHYYQNQVNVDQNKPFA